MASIVYRDVPAHVDCEERSDAAIRSTYRCTINVLSQGYGFPRADALGMTDLLRRSYLPANNLEEPFAFLTDSFSD